jgi:hypothetical protein
VFRDPTEGGFWSWIVKYIFRVRENGDANIFVPQIAGKAKKKLYIVSGNLDSEVWQSPKVIKSLMEAADKGVDIRILFDSARHPHNVELRKLAQHKKLHLYEYHEAIGGHFIVADGKHVRLEELHLRDAPQRAWVLENTRALGNQLESEFLNLLQAARLLDEKELGVISPLEELMA